MTRTVARRSPCRPSGGGVFEMELVEDRSYIFVSHQFDQAGKGAVGMMRVGTDMGTAGVEHS